MGDAHVYALLLVLEVLGEGCTETFGNWEALSSKKSRANFSMGDSIAFLLATTEYCNVGTMLVQPGSKRLFGFSFLNTDVFNVGLIKYTLEEILLWFSLSRYSRDKILLCAEFCKPE